MHDSVKREFCMLGLSMMYETSRLAQVDASVKTFIASSWVSCAARAPPSVAKSVAMQQWVKACGPQEE